MTNWTEAERASVKSSLAEQGIPDDEQTVSDVLALAENPWAAMEKKKLIEMNVGLLKQLRVAGEEANRWQRIAESIRQAVVASGQAAGIPVTEFDFDHFPVLSEADKQRRIDSGPFYCDTCTRTLILNPHGDDWIHLPKGQGYGEKQDD